MVLVLPKQQPLSARLGVALGQGLGQGFSEQFPREMERARLSKGLQQFAFQSGQMTPLEQLSYISTIPGITPQMIQSFGELAKQQAQAGAISRGIPPKGGRPGIPQPQGEPSPTGGPEATTSKFPFPEGYKPQPKLEKAPTVATPAGTQATIQNYIPPTLSQIYDRAGQLYETNPALYKNDPNLAVEAAYKEAQLEEAQINALKGQRQGQRDVLKHLSSRS